MEFEIDQSGKIEQTNINTVVAITNDQEFVIIFKKRDKRLLERIFEKMGKRKVYPYLIFAALVSILIKFAKIDKKVIIDQEYFGHEVLIITRCYSYLKLAGHKKHPTIEFGRIGKLSKAHDLAAKVGSGKRKADKIVRLEEVLELVLGTKNDRESAFGGSRTT